ncbi:hypothetical protein RHGRI_034752 [Rhododendron griersonianum]|uniref:Uncharacterized protein n=1 Tax=Rhododendron griersonianum TaxID=479676 RepID=A0AAV6I7J3_9ERIC|nr:hypothetical protein RHGRI_034752 [Rhododendron griersonianum]
MHLKSYNFSLYLNTQIDPKIPSSSPYFYLICLYTTLYQHTPATPPPQRQAILFLFFFLGTLEILGNPILRQYKDEGTQSEVTDCRSAHGSCDTGPRLHIDAGRLSFNNLQKSFLSWGYLIGSNFLSFSGGGLKLSPCSRSLGCLHCICTMAAGIRNDEVIETDYRTYGLCFLSFPFHGVIARLMGSLKSKPRKPASPSPQSPSALPDVLCT